MGLGDFRFEIGTAAYQKLQRTQGFRWEKQDRIGRAPALQFTGPDLIAVELEGTIYTAFKGGLGQVLKMRELAAKGEPQDLVDGTGKVWGPYVILDVAETQSVFLADGRPRRIDFTVKLQEYGQDAGAA
ncbi:phage tail protein [Azospirillum cavernae]|uniref:Phage tail protein n=2 Tax=Azospirillum cavernae TaxID=2320860 RepID=A0A418VYW2_9PROT|nr:phage tail protein [Azospirillum cavernae]